MEEKEELLEWKCFIEEGLEEEESRDEGFFHRMFIIWLAKNGIFTDEHFEQFLEEYALWNIAQEHGNSVGAGPVYGIA